MVKITKEIMSRTNQGGKDAFLVVLVYRVILRGPGKLSPAEAMTQHKLRDLLLMKQHLSTQLNASKEIMLQQRQRQAEQYDCMACQLLELQQSQLVHVQLHPGQLGWQRAVVTRMPTSIKPRAYQVQTSLGAR